MKKKRKIKFYSDDFKRRVVEDVLSGKMGKEEARIVYGIKGNSAILSWIRKFGFDNNIYMKTDETEESVKMNETINLTVAERRIKELEADLKRERIRADLWQKMVDLAEEQFEIDIRKKFGAKLSIPSKSKKGSK